MASTGDSSEPSNRRPASGAGSAPLPSTSSGVTGELPADRGLQIGPPEGGVIYVAVLAGPVATFQPSPSLTLTAMSSELSETAVSSETANWRMFSDMSGPLSDKPNGTTPHDQVNNTCLPAGQRLNMTLILLQVSVRTVPSLFGCGRLALVA